MLIKVIKKNKKKKKLKGRKKTYQNSEAESKRVQLFKPKSKSKRVWNDEIQAKVQVKERKKRLIDKSIDKSINQLP